MAIKQCRDSFIAIDNADCLINDDVRRYTNMRDSIENISQLQKKLNDLQLENQILRNMLDKAGLSYYKELSAFRKMIVKKLMIWNREKNYSPTNNNRKYGK